MDYIGHKGSKNVTTLYSEHVCLCWKALFGWSFASGPINFQQPLVTGGDVGGLFWPHHQCSAQDDWVEELSALSAMLLASCMILGKSQGLPMSLVPSVSCKTPKISDHGVCFLLKTFK